MSQAVDGSFVAWHDSLPWFDATVNRLGGFHRLVTDPDQTPDTRFSRKLGFAGLNVPQRTGAG